MVCLAERLSIANSVSMEYADSLMFPERYVDLSFIEKRGAERRINSDSTLR